MRVIAFHAHPDDEALLTGGVLARAARCGVRVEVVFATSGEQGDRHGTFGVKDGDLRLIREAEAASAAACLGVSACYFLRLPDSGWKASAVDAASDCLARRDAREVASLAALACPPRPSDILLAPDLSGTYGHPDHVKVSEVAHLLVEGRYVSIGFMASLNRKHLLRTLPQGSAVHAFVQTRPLLGLPAETAGTAVDVRAQAGLKHDAMLAHASQLRPGSLLQVFAGLSDEEFELALGYEWLARIGQAGMSTDADRHATDLLGLGGQAAINPVS